MAVRYKHKASIVVLSHRKQLVGEAMMSAMQQTHPSVQVLVTYSTRGPDFTRVNQQVEASTGEWVGVLCDDDLLDERYVERLMRFESHADVLYTDRIPFWDAEDAGPEDKIGFVQPTHSRQIQGPCRTFLDPQRFILGSPLLMTMLVRRTFWDAHGGLDVIPHGDTEFWYRLIRGKKGTPPARTVYVPEPLFYYRAHQGQLSKEEDTMVPALRAFHRKHFQDFGMIVGRGTGKAVRPLQLGFVKPHQRLAYATAQFTPLTTAGWSSMPTETKPLSSVAKLALKLQLDKAQKETDQVITAIMQDAGLDPEDGWKITPEGDAQREVASQPEGPVLVLNAPADAPIALTTSPSVPLDAPVAEVPDEPVAETPAA